MKKRSTRRAFLRSSVLATGGCVWSAASPWRAVAASATPAKLVIIDTHTHFYDPGRPQGVPWPDKGDQVLYRRVLPADYRALPNPEPVTGTVVVEASSWVEDNQWILDLAANDPFIVGFVGNLPVGKDGFRAHLKRFASNRIFRGLRIGGDRLHAGLGDKIFMDDLRELAANDLALDVLGGPEALPDTARLAKEIPALRLVIDHVANLRIDGKTPPAAWVNDMRRAGERPNVYCKVSGLVEGTGKSNGDAPAEVGFYQPVLQMVWEAFGVDHLIYGSNWPVSERFAPLATVQKIARDFFRDRGEIATEKAFSGNALAAYKWVKR